MNLKFANKKITGMLTILPSNEVRFEDEVNNYDAPPARTMRLKAVMGYDRHRIVKGDACVSDFGVHGLQYLFDKGRLDKADVDALIVVTQSPDYFIPPTSNVIQGKLGLKRDMICMDINQGCAGFLLGLMQAFMLLEQASINKVVLLNAEILSRRKSKKDRNSYPISGDAASITIVEKDESAGAIYANIKMDGSRGGAIIIPAGGLRLPCSPETAVLEDVGESNWRSKEHLSMDGMAVFNFVQEEVPPMIEDLLACSGVPEAAIDYYMFHQPNRFMLEKLADRLKVSYDRLPANIVQNFGNASSVTIPTNITFNLGDRLTKERLKLCLAGFGSGLTWSSMLVDVGPLDFCEMIDYDA